MATTGPALSAVSVLAVRRRVWPLVKLAEQQRKSALGVCCGYPDVSIMVPAIRIAAKMHCGEDAVTDSLEIGARRLRLAVT